MKRFLLFTLLFCSAAVFGQFKKNTGELAGGLGVNYIDGEAFYAVQFRPELAVGKFGLGLDLNLEFGKNGLRKENFNEASDYLSIIRYVRYGLKNDPLYVRLGAIDGYSIGHGSIMYMYNNSPSFDTRKIGVVLDYNAGSWGFESIYGDLSQGAVTAARVHMQPLQYTSMRSIPILSGIEVGATFATDFHENANVYKTIMNMPGKYEYVDTDNVSVLGFDLGLPIIRQSFVSLDLYADFVKFLNYGSGTSAGVQFGFNGLGLVSAGLKFERRWNNDQYIPGYFGSLYEVERFSFNPTSRAVQSKVQELAGIKSAEVGYFGSLNIDVLHLLNIYGSFQKLDTVANSGILEMTAAIEPQAVPFVARGGYSKTGIQDAADMFKVDDRSYLYAEVGYKPYSYLLVSFIYHWTFTPVRDLKDNIIGYETQKRIEPRVTFTYPLNFGK